MSFGTGLSGIAAANKDRCTPEWCRSVRPLAEPVFTTELVSLRLHLLLHAPIPFRRRNIFVDASVGDRV